MRGTEVGQFYGIIQGLGKTIARTPFALTCLVKPTKKKSERGWSYGTSPWQVSVSAESFQPRETDDCRQTGDGAEGGEERREGGGAEGAGREEGGGRGGGLA